MTAKGKAGWFAWDSTSSAAEGAGSTSQEGRKKKKARKGTERLRSIHSSSIRPRVIHVSRTRELPQIEAADERRKTEEKGEGSKENKSGRKEVIKKYHAKDTEQ